MSQIKKISIKLFCLIMDMFLLVYKIIKGIRLPGRKQRGNLLSSLFNFFVGILETLNFIEYDCINVATLFKRKYIKQIIFSIGFVLFLLSLFEWPGDLTHFNTPETTNTEQLSIAITAKEVVKSRQAKSRIYETVVNKAPSEFHSPFNISLATSLPVKKFLFIRNLRI